MKRLLTVMVAGVCLTTSFASFAANVCPTASDIRNGDGSRMVLAKRDIDSSFKWMFASKSFDFNNKTWQVVYTTGVDVITSEPEIALKYGQRMFDGSPMWAKAREGTGSELTACQYANMDSDGYSIYAFSPAIYGIR